MYYYTDHCENQEAMASARTRHGVRRYYGLKNQGSTCYLNSVLQCLYMTEDFRTEIEKFRPDSQNFHEPDLILELQKLFKKLEKVNGTTEGITRTLHISSVHEQQDVVEYYQKTLKAIGPQAAKIFEGKLSNKTKCTKDHISEEQHHFFTIPLSIETAHSEVYSVVKGLEAFFQVSKLDEDNWLCCEKCRQKTETETWTEIEEFPTILTLYLKRFYYDYNRWELVKNHCRMDIPLKLEMNGCGLSRDHQESSNTRQEHLTDRAAIHHKNIGYELYAVINHLGEITGGHYNVVIKSFEDDEWYCFDDCSVTKQHSNFQDLESLHSDQALLLMYRKVDKQHLDEKSTNELLLRCHEYCDLVTTMQQWIQDYINEFEKSGFPTSYQEIETLCLQFLEFKMTQLPQKEAEKKNAEHIYKTFKGAVKAGYIKVPPGCNPPEVERKWRQLHEAINKRERLVRNEFKGVYCFFEHLLKQCSDYNLTVMPSITESLLTYRKLDEVMLCYIQDLLSWVKNSHSCILDLQWEADLSSIESHLTNYQILNQSIERFKHNIYNAQKYESQLIPSSKYRDEYRVNLAELNRQYNELPKTSLDHLLNLTSLKTFVEAVIDVRIWLNERIEDEIKYDWSDHNINLSAKTESYSGLIEDMQKTEERVNNIQADGDRLLKEGHPAESAIKASFSALQNQWCWMQQLCHCIKAHLEKNIAYFQFFAEVKEADEKIRKTQEEMKQKYMYDCSSISTLEHLLQDTITWEEREQFIKFKTYLESLAMRAKNIVQLKPRNPSTPVKGNLHIQAVCDYENREITVHKGDTYVLLNHSQSFHWNVKSLNGKKITVPSICFIILPTNNEAVESSSGLAANWQKLYEGMKSLLSWQYLRRDLQYINAAQDNQALAQALNNLKQHYQIFMNEDSVFFSADERKQGETAYENVTQRYNNPLQLMTQEEQDDSVLKSYVTQIKNIFLRLERFESHLVSCIRQPMDIEPIRACAQEATEHEKPQTSEFNNIKKDLDAVVEESEAVLATCQQQSTWAPILQKEIDFTLKRMEHVNNLFSVYLERVKCTDLQIHSTQGTEMKTYNQLCDLHKVPTNEKELESNQVQPKKLHCEAEADDNVNFLASVKKTWQTAIDQGKFNLQKADELDGQLQAFGQSYEKLIEWIADAKKRQEKIQAKSITDNKNELLTQGKKLLEEIENKKDKVEECANYSTACRNAIEYQKDQLALHKALMEPCSFTYVESVLERIIQKNINLQTQYKEVLTMARQIFVFYDKQQCLEKKEKANKKLEERKKMIKIQPELEKQTQLAESHALASAREDSDVEKQKQNSLQDIRDHSDQEIKHESQQQQHQLETTVKQKSGRKSETVEQETAEKDGKAITRIKKRKAEEEIKQKSEAQQGVVKQNQKKAEDLKTFEQKTVKAILSYPTQFQQNADMVEHQKEAAEEEADKHAKAQERTEKLRKKHETETGGPMSEFHPPNDAAMKPRPINTDKVEIGHVKVLTDPTTDEKSVHAPKGKRSSRPSVCRELTVDQITKKELSGYKEYHKDPTNHQTCRALVEQEHERKDASTSKSMITDSRSAHKNVTDVAFHSEHIDQSAIDQDLTGSSVILSSNMSDLRSHSSSFGSSSSDPINPVSFIRNPATCTEVMGPIAGILNTDTQEKLSVTEAMHQKLVDTMTGQRLLEAQACTGGIIDPKTGVKFSVVDAVKKGLVDDTMLGHLGLAQMAFEGFKDSKVQIKMSAAQAFKERWLPYEIGQRFLEVQYLTGGLIEPDVAGRLSLDDAMKKGILDAYTAQKLTDVSGYCKYLTCPETKLNISYKDAIERSQIEKESGLLFLKASTQSTKYLWSHYSI